MRRARRSRLASRETPAATPLRKRPSRLATRRPILQPNETTPLSCNGMPCALRSSDEIAGGLCPAVEPQRFTDMQHGPTPPSPPLKPDVGDNRSVTPTPEFDATTMTVAQAAEIKYRLNQQHIRDHDNRSQVKSGKLAASYPTAFLTVLPSAETAATLFWALLASGQINMRKVDGWTTLATKPTDQPIDLAA